MCDMTALLHVQPLSGLLHAAGVGASGLLANVTPAMVQWQCESKAGGAWYVRCAASILSLDARVLFSSVGSGLGNVGQGSYAIANACLDAQVLSCRSHGTMACALQWPLVGGAGMGAAAFAAIAARQISLVGMTGIALEDYAACLVLS
jgi:hypothetical protein